jgi:hypothetical protein
LERLTLLGSLRPARDRLEHLPSDMRACLLVCREGAADQAHARWRATTATTSTRTRPRMRAPALTMRSSRRCGCGRA